jgi:hypothetical protein
MVTLSAAMAHDPTKIGLSTSTSTASLTSLGLVFGYYRPPESGKPAAEIPPSDDPIYALIGRVASTWSHLEHILDEIIWDLVGIEASRVACITGQIIGATNRYRAITSLIKQRMLKN